MTTRPRHGARRWLFALAALAALAVAGSIVAGIRFVHTPRYSLYRAGLAARVHDLETFRKYVDVHSVAASVADTIVDQALRSPRADRFRKTMSGRLGAALLKGRLTGLLEARIVEYVRTGSLPIVPAARALRGIRRQGSSASVLVSVERRGQDPLVAELAMRDRGGYWQVTAVTRIEGLGVLEALGRLLPLPSILPG